jgi:phasin family protein
MYNVPTQFADAGKSGIEAMLAIANTAFSSIERLAALNLNTARTMLEDSMTMTKSMLAIKDMQELISLQTSLTKPSLEKAADYSRALYEIITQTQGEMSKVYEAQLTELKAAVTGVVDNAIKNAPAGSEVAVAAVKSAIAAANSAYDNMTKAAKQVAQMTEANVAAATTATIHAVGATTTAPKGRKVA